MAAPRPPTSPARRRAGRRRWHEARCPAATGRGRAGRLWQEGSAAAAGTARPGDLSEGVSVVLTPYFPPLPLWDRVGMRGRAKTLGALELRPPAPLVV